MLYSPDLWYLDATESMIFAFLLGIYGVKVITENVYQHKRDEQEFMKLDSESKWEESSSGVHEKSKLIQVAKDKGLQQSRPQIVKYTTFPSDRGEA